VQRDGLGPAPVRHPRWTSIAVAIGRRLAIFAAAFGLPPLVVAGFPDLGALVVNAVAALVPLGVIAYLGWWHQPWLATIRPRKWWPLAPLAPLAVLFRTGGRDCNWWSCWLPGSFSSAEPNAILGMPRDGPGLAIIRLMTVQSMGVPWSIGCRGRSNRDGPGLANIRLMTVQSIGCRDRPNRDEPESANIRSMTVQSKGVPWLIEPGWTGVGEHLVHNCG